MELVSFSLPALLRKTNVKLLLMLISAIVCLIIILTSSRRFAIPHEVPSSIGGNDGNHVNMFGEVIESPVHTVNNDQGSSEPVVFADVVNHGNIEEEESVTVALGVAVTSHNEPHLNLDNVGYKLPFLRSLVPSFCRTASAGYRYRFYVAFDVHDPHFHLEAYMTAVDNRFREIVTELCIKNSVNVSLHFVQCNHNKNPAWAQNDAMMEAYLDNNQYYYRVNDDTKMLSPEWTQVFIKTLKSFSPPNVGVVGPLHKGGNQAILTYDFVHRTHIDVFGYYYPRIFTDWFADTWMSRVYGTERTLKLPGVKLVHTEELGQRYQQKNENSKYLEEQVEEDCLTLKRYLKSVEDASRSTQPKNSAQRSVISMSLWGSKTRYVYGALRNAQLVPVHFPGWTLRIYIERPSVDGSTSFQPVPSRIVAKLAALGAEIIYVDAERSHVPPMMWRFLVADDLQVDVFIVRDSDCRLSDRDFAVVTEWLRTDYSFHCIRDHPSHANYPVLGGLWGARPSRLKSFITVPWRDLMMGYRSDYIQDMQFLENAIWPSVQAHAAFCHDSVSCMKWSGSHPFPVSRIGTEHLGQVFDAFGNARDEDIQILLENRPSSQCTLAHNQTHVMREDSISSLNLSMPREIIENNRKRSVVVTGIPDSERHKGLAAKAHHSVIMMPSPIIPNDNFKVNNYIKKNIETNHLITNTSLIYNGLSDTEHQAGIATESRGISNDYNQKNVHTSYSTRNTSRIYQRVNKNEHRAKFKTVTAFPLISNEKLVPKNNLSHNASHVHQRRNTTYLQIETTIESSTISNGYIKKNLKTNYLIHNTSRIRRPLRSPINVKVIT